MENYKDFRQRVKKMKLLEVNKTDRRYLIEKENSCYGNLVGFSAEFSSSIDEAIKRGLRGNDAYSYIENPKAFELNLEKEGILVSEKDGLYL